MIRISDEVSPFAGSPIATPSGLIPEGMFPSGYIEKRIHDATVVSHGSTMPFFEEMLASHPTLYDWAAAQSDVRVMQGRHAAYAAPLPDTDVGVVVRHSQHGGMLAPLSRDLFRTPRAAHELRINWTLRHVGIPSPRLLGYALYPAMNGTLWRADVVTREITDSADLAKVLGAAGASFDPAQAIDATVTLLKRLSRTWAHHPDLNVKNILIAADENGTLVAHVLDVDTLRFAERNAETLNLARLVRSARKWLSRDGGKAFAQLIERLGG